RSTAQCATAGSAAMALPSDGMSVTAVPLRHANVCLPAGSQSPSVDVGLFGTGVFTWIVVWYAPFASKYENSGAMWLSVVWQLAQMTAEVSWKSIFAVGVFVFPVMLLKSHGLV